MDESTRDIDIRKVERALRTARRHAALALLVVAVLAIVALRQSLRSSFTEIDAERINIVEADGTPRLAIANATRMPPITFHGKTYPSARNASASARAGMIYFNDEGTEDGGYSWSGKRLPDGTYQASGVLTFDQYDQGEAMALWYADNNGQRRAGMIVYDQPEGSLQASLDSGAVFRSIRDSAERVRRAEAYRETRLREGGGIQPYTPRLWVGKDPTKASLVTLSDPKGRPRLRLSVDSLGVARVEFLDEQGEVTKAITGDGSE